MEGASASWLLFKELTGIYIDMVVVILHENIFAKNRNKNPLCVEKITDV